MPTFTTRTLKGRLRLNCVGTIEDLAQQRVVLREGMPLTLYADDLDAKGELDELRVDGIASFSEEEHCWVAVIDWSAIHHASEESVTPAHGEEDSSERSARGNERTNRCT
jgi:hypothetical protein